MKALLRFDGKFCFQKIPRLSVLLNICDLFSGSLETAPVKPLIPIRPKSEIQHKERIEKDQTRSKRDVVSK